MCRKYFKDGINNVLDKLRAKINEQTEEEDKKNEYVKKQKNEDAPQAKQVVSTNPTLDALGFNHSLKYGNRSKLRTACMRFLRFSYLLDFLATEALTNVYLFSVKDTIQKLTDLRHIPVRIELSEEKPFSRKASLETVDYFKLKRNTQTSVREMPFFKVQAAVNPEMMTLDSSSRRPRMSIPQSHLRKVLIDEYFPEPAGKSDITDFNPTVHLVLESE